MEQALPPLRSRLEGTLALTLAIGTGLAVVLLSGIATRYHIAAVLAAAGIGVLSLLPDRRAICVALWVLIQPLSVEMVFYLDSRLYPKFIPQAIVINAADAVLALLLVFLCIESLFTRRRVWAWTRPTMVWGVFILWAAVSFMIHWLLQTTVVSAALLELLRLLRLLLMAVLIQSAIRTRADLVIVLLALAFMVLAESILVMLSHFADQIFNYTSLGTGDSSGPSVSLQQFSNGGGESISRATGTLGHTNQQAAYHTFFTLPLIGLLAMRKAVVRWIALAVIFASAFAILLTFSRGAWLAFPLALLTAFVIAARRRLLPRNFWLLGGVLAIGVAAVLGALAPKIYQRLTSGDDGATDARLRMMSLASDLFMSEPVLGVGPGEYFPAALAMYPPEYHQPDWVPPGGSPPGSRLGHLDVIEVILPGYPEIISPAQVHNKYLLVAAELGVPGLLIFVWMFRAFWREAWVCVRSSDRLLKFVGISGVGAIVAIMTYMMVDLFADDKTMALLLFVPILVTAAARLARAESGEIR